MGVQVQSNRRQPKAFNFERNFAILSLLCVFVISSGSAILLLRFLTSHMLERDAVVTMQFIQSMTEIEQTHSQIDLSSLPALAQREAIVELLSHISHAPDIIRATVHAPDQMVVWSTDPDLIGKRFSDNQHLEKALAGELIFEFVDRGNSNKEEHAYFPDDVTAFVENYIPIRNPAHTEVIAVAEIYRAPSVLLDAVSRGRWLIWSGAAVSALFLYFTLFWIVRRANNLMHSQQERLVESETMVAIGEMASAVAHGIRNPLASIRSSAELSLEEDDPATTKEIAQDIITEADRMENWIRELILYAHPEREEFVSVRFSDLISTCMDGFTRAIERQGVQLKLNVEDSVRPIQGDAALLEHLVNNVISNALEAMPDGGTLTIGLGMTRDGNSVEITVNDSGHGIPKDQVSQIFKPFITSKKRGLGLGLMLVKRIGERHNGTIAISSDVGRGTSVSLRFPAMAES